ncbi:membrane protein [Cryptosporidium xiaoi]|uniref:Membrane protein n=1 Tax=Cryptosporidium xiaoi TaxID=659607 RepID=A0AAV9Y3F3_9CRYT
MSKEKVDLIRMEIISQNSQGICLTIKNKLIFTKKWIYYIIYLIYCWISRLCKRKKKNEVLIYKSYVYGQLLSVISAGVWWGFFGTTVILLMDSEIVSGISRLIFNLIFIVMSPISGTLTLIFGMKNILVYANTTRIFIWCTFCPLLYYIGIVYKYSKMADIIGLPLFYILIGFDAILVSLVNINDLDCGGLGIISYENEFEITDIQKSQIIYTYLNLFDLTFIIINPSISTLIFFILCWYYRHIVLKNNTFNNISNNDNSVNNNGIEIPILIILTLFQLLTFLSIIFYRFGIPSKKNNFNICNSSGLDSNTSEFEVRTNSDNYDNVDVNNDVYRSFKMNIDLINSTELGNYFSNSEDSILNENVKHDIGESQDIDDDGNDDDDYDYDYNVDEIDSINEYCNNDYENLDNDIKSNDDMSILPNQKSCVYNLLKKKFCKKNKRLKLRDKLTFTLIKNIVLNSIQDIYEMKYSRIQLFRAISLGFETGMEDAMMTCIIPLFIIHLSKKLTIFDNFIIDNKTIKLFSGLYDQNIKKTYLASISLLIVSFVFSIGKLSNLILKLIYKKYLFINHKFNINTSRNNVNISNNNNSINITGNLEINTPYEYEYSNNERNDFNVNNTFGINSYLLYNISSNIINSPDSNYLNELIIKRIKKLFIYTLIANLSVIILPITLTFFNYFLTLKNSNNLIQVISKFDINQSSLNYY